jgi:2-phosphosulfolactate phosphatase
MANTVIIDCFPSSVAQYCDKYAIVAIDVIRATTLAVTAVAEGRRCIAAVDLEESFQLRDKLGNALLAGELGGEMPDGFDMNNSPAELAERNDRERPMVMLSSSGTQLMLEASKSPQGAYLACFRNYIAVAGHLATCGKDVAVIGAGSRNEFREEDQMCCAWVAEELIKAGFKAANPFTTEVISRWRGAAPDACAHGNSVAYLRRSGQLKDFDFILEHVNDVPYAVVIEGNEIVGVEAARPISMAAA